MDRSGLAIHLGHLEGEQLYLGDLLTMITNHLLIGMIQVLAMVPTNQPGSNGKYPRVGGLQ